VHRVHRASPSISFYYCTESTAAINPRTSDAPKSGVRSGREVDTPFLSMARYSRYDSQIFRGFVSLQTWLSLSLSLSLARARARAIASSRRSAAPLVHPRFDWRGEEFGKEESTTRRCSSSDLVDDKFSDLATCVVCIVDDNDRDKMSRERDERPADSLGFVSRGSTRDWVTRRNCQRYWPAVD